MSIKIILTISILISIISCKKDIEEHSYYSYKLPKKYNLVDYSNPPCFKTVINGEKPVFFIEGHKLPDALGIEKIVYSTQNICVFKGKSKYILVNKNDVENIKSLNKQPDKFLKTTNGLYLINYKKGNKKEISYNGEESVEVEKGDIYLNPNLEDSIMIIYTEKKDKHNYKFIVKGKIEKTVKKMDSAIYTKCGLFTFEREEEEMTIGDTFYTTFVRHNQKKLAKIHGYFGLDKKGEKIKIHCTDDENGVFTFERSVQDGEAGYECKSMLSTQNIKGKSKFVPCLEEIYPLKKHNGFFAGMGNKKLIMHKHTAEFKFEAYKLYLKGKAVAKFPGRPNSVKNKVNIVETDGNLSVCTLNKMENACFFNDKLYEIKKGGVDTKLGRCKRYEDEVLCFKMQQTKLRPAGSKYGGVFLNLYARVLGRVKINKEDKLKKMKFSTGEWPVIVSKNDVFVIGLKNEKLVKASLENKIVDKELIDYRNLLKPVDIYKKENKYIVHSYINQKQFATEIDINMVKKLEIKNNKMLMQGRSGKRRGFFLVVNKKEDKILALKKPLFSYNDHECYRTDTVIICYNRKKLME